LGSERKSESMLRRRDQRSLRTIWCFVRLDVEEERERKEKKGMGGERTSSLGW